jgi:hypothetical protein
MVGKMPDEDFPASPTSNVIKNPASIKRRGCGEN